LNVVVDRLVLLREQSVKLINTERRITQVQRKSAIVMMAVVSVSALGCTVRERRPDGPYREAQELTDALSDATVACVRKHAPPGTGALIIAADLARAGEAPIIHDIGSSAGCAAVIACVTQRSNEKLHNPNSTPAPFVRIRVPLPLVTSEVTYAFMTELPPSEAVGGAQPE
jgi:hypothetical protein